MSEELVPRPLRVAAAYCWRLLVVAAAVLAAALVLIELRLVVLPVILALLLSTLLVPPARWLSRRGVPRLLGTAAVLAGAALLLVGVGAAVAPPLVDELGTIERDAREGAAEVLDWLAKSPLGLSEPDVERYVERAFDWGYCRSGAGATSTSSARAHGACSARTCAGSASWPSWTPRSSASRCS